MSGCACTNRVSVTPSSCVLPAPSGWRKNSPSDYCSTDSTNLMCETRGGHLLRRVIIQVAFDGVEQAIDKLSCVTGREAAGDFECFVDRHRFRVCGLVDEFIDRHPQQIAVDDRHSYNPPIFGTQSDPLVNFVKMSDRADHQLVGKTADLLRRLRHLPPVGLD